MALTSCPECGGKLSTSATQCPHCGIAGAHLGAAHAKKARQGWVSAGALVTAVGMGMMFYGLAAYGDPGSFVAVACSAGGAVTLVGVLIVSLATKGIGEYLAALIAVVFMGVFGAGVGLCLGSL